MIRGWAGLLLVCGVLMTGCSEQESPPPQFNEAMDYGDRKLVPLEVPQRADDQALLRPAASVDEVHEEVEKAASRPAGGQDKDSAQAAIDLSTPQRAVESLSMLLQQGAYDRVAKVIAEPVREPVSRLIETVHPVLEARRDLLAALDSAFPDHNVQVVLPPQLVMGMTGAWRVGEVTGEAQDQASVRITSADGQRTWNWPVTRSGDVWQVVLPVQSGNLSFLNAPLFQQGIADAVERLESIRADVVQGRIADADEAAAAIDEAVEAVNANFR